jgi:hypothetical protein
MTTSTVAKKVTPVAAKRAPVKRAAASATQVAAKKSPVAKSPIVRKSSAVKTAKDKKPKLVRDSFTFPKAEYEVLEAMKQRATKLKVTVKKTELLRAGIKSLAALGDAAFLSAIAAVPSLKTGRPAKA